MKKRLRFLEFKDINKLASPLRARNKTREIRNYKDTKIGEYSSTIMDDNSAIEISWFINAVQYPYGISCGWLQFDLLLYAHKDQTLASTKFIIIFPNTTAYALYFRIVCKVTEDHTPSLRQIASLLRLSPLFTRISVNREHILSCHLHQGRWDFI